MHAVPRLRLGIGQSLRGGGAAVTCALPAHHLVTHGVIVGMTGSGKTGLVTVIAEETLRAKVPVLMIDVKGDLPDLLLAFPTFSPEPFLPWVETAREPGDDRSSEEVATAHGRQLGFWGGDQAAHDRADRALARVQGMLGYDAVTTAVAQGGRTPREQVRWIPWGELREPLLPLDAAWPGALPAPHPARVFDPPLPAEVVDAHGDAVCVSGRGEQVAAPAHIRCAGLPDGGGLVRAWAGPWAHDVRWWDHQMHRRCARWQVVVGEVACVVVVEAGQGGVEAIYD